MTIASALENLNTDIINARTAITTKGGTVTVNGGSSQLATDIATIPTGGSATLITKSITANGTYNASSDSADGYSSVNVNVPTGITPTGTRTITANGTYDVTNYASADVNVSGGVSSKYGATVDSFLGDVDANGVLQAPTSQTNLVFNGVEDVGNYGLFYRFYNNSSIRSASFPDLTTISGLAAMQYAFRNSGLTSIDLSSLTTVNAEHAMRYAFQSCSNLTNVDLSNLTTISGDYAMAYAFQNCLNITSVDLSSLTSVSDSYAMAYAFEYCTGLLTILFNNLETIGIDTSSENISQFNNCFNKCSNLTTLTFPKLKEIYCTGPNNVNGTFSFNNKVEKMYFPKLDTITYGTGASVADQISCKNVFYGCSALTELHFGAANQAAIEASPGYSTAWGRGAGNVTIYFDL